MRGQRPEIPPVRAADYLNEKRGVFVTLKNRDSSLRGCVGFPHPVKPLGDAIVEAAIAAAAHDPRFTSVTEEELPGILVEVSVLTVPRRLRASRPLELPKEVRIGVDGLIVSDGVSSGLLLPQVATELNLTSEDFLSETCMKAGLLPDAWLKEATTIQVFQAEVFAETSPRGGVVRELLKEG